MYWQFFSVATVGKGALVFSLVASAYGGASLETPRPRTAQPTPAAKVETSTVSFEALLSECIARYKRGASNAKETCEHAIAASGLDSAAFAAKYGSLLVPPAPKTEKPTPTSKPETTTTTPSFESLLGECVARYKRGATNTKEACERASAASGLSLDAFVAKYRSLLVPPARTQTTKPTATPKPVTAPKLNTADPRVKECLAKYEVLKTLKTASAQTFEAALKSFNETCKSVLEAARR
jgi:hypothetical protein